MADFSAVIITDDKSKEKMIEFLNKGYSVGPVFQDGKQLLQFVYKSPFNPIAQELQEIKEALQWGPNAMKRNPEIRAAKNSFTASSAPATTRKSRKGKKQKQMQRKNRRRTQYK